MTWDEIRKRIDWAITNSHVFYQDSDIDGPVIVRSVAVRMDEDGTASVIMYGKRMPGRIISKDQEATKRALKVGREVLKLEPGLANGGTVDEFYYSLDIIGQLLDNAGVPTPVGGDPFEAVREFVQGYDDDTKGEDGEEGAEDRSEAEP